MIDKVIFVCTGNTCRSPMAEALFKSMIQDTPIETASRGMVVLFPEPVNPKAEAILNNHNLTMETHTTKPLVREDITEDTLLLTMTGTQAERIRHHFADASEVYTIKEYVGEQGDVVDPYGKSIVEYEECFAELARLVKKVVYSVSQK